MTRIRFEDPQVQEYFDLRFKSIRVRSLQKLILVTWHLLYSRNNELHQRVKKRMYEKNAHLNYDHDNIVYSLEPQDVIDVIGCSKRTAIDYVQTMKQLTMLFHG